MCDVQKDKWYVVTAQGVEKGPFDSYREAKDCADDSCGYEQVVYGEAYLDDMEEFGDDDASFAVYEDDLSFEEEEDETGWDDELYFDEDDD